MRRRLYSGTRARSPEGERYGDFHRLRRGWWHFPCHLPYHVRVGVPLPSRPFSGFLAPVIGSLHFPRSLAVCGLGSMAEGSDREQELPP